MSELDKKKEDKPKEQKYAFDILGSFQVSVKENKPKKILRKILIRNGAQLRNALIILERELYKQSKSSKENKYVYDLFMSSATLRDSLYNRTGEKGSKETAKKLKILKNALKDNCLWKETCFLVQNRIDSK